MPRPTEEREGRGGRRVREGEIEGGCITEKGREDENMAKGTDKKERSKEGVREGERTTVERES